MLKKKSEIKYMQLVMQTPFCDLQKIKNDYDINMMKNVKKLKEFFEFMKNKAYLDFLPQKNEKSIEDKKIAVLMREELKNIKSYWKFILDKKVGDEFVPYDPVLLKLRPSPYKGHQYFKCFHDLECLKTIVPDPEPQSIEYYLSLVRKDIFKQPIRQKVLESARQQWQKFQFRVQTESLSEEQKFKIMFSQLPSKSQSMSADELEESIYKLDDLNIDFSWMNEQQEEIDDLKEVEIITENKELGKSSFEEGVDFLEKQLQHLNQNDDRQYQDGDFSYY